MTEIENKFDICGYEGNNPKTCQCLLCKQYRNETVPYSQFMSEFTKSNKVWLATKLNVDYEDKDEVKQMGARWSKVMRVWFVRYNCPNYNEIIKRWGK